MASGIGGLVCVYGIPRDLVHCHLHHKCFPGGHRWCRGVLSDELLWSSVAWTVLIVCSKLPLLVQIALP